MYREKLIEQLKVLEETQRKFECSGLEIVSISEEILKIAKKIDKLDENVERTINIGIGGEKIYEAVRNYCTSYEEKHGQPNL